MAAVIKYFPVLLLILLFPLNTGQALDTRQEDSILSFSWSFFQCSRDGQIVMLNTENTIRFSGSNVFKFFLKPDKNVYLYLFHYSSEKELTLLFPSRHFFSGQDYVLGQGYFIPGADQWFGVKPGEKSGSHTDKFYLIASVHRQVELETATRKYLEAAQSVKPDLNRKNSLKQQVLNRIITLKNANSMFAAPVETPVRITTRYRGNESMTDNTATRVEALLFYARTIRLEY